MRFARRYLLAVAAVSWLAMNLLPSVWAQEAMCGQQILHPENGTMYQFIDGFDLRVTPWRSVTDPVFEITTPTGLFIGPYVNNAGLLFKVTGCIVGTDSFAKGYGVIPGTYQGLITTTAGAIKGVVLAGVECKISVYRNDMEAKEDLRFPRREFGNVTHDGNFFYGWQVRIKDSNGVLMNVGLDAYNRTASVHSLNELLNVTMYSNLYGIPKFQGFATGLSQVFIEFDPGMADPHDTLPNEGDFYEPVDYKPKPFGRLMDPLHTKLGPSTYQLNFTWNQPGVFTGALNKTDAYRLDIEGCLTATNASFIVLTDTTAYADLGYPHHVDKVHCKITITSRGGGINFPKVDDLWMQLVIDHNHHVMRHSGKIIPRDHTHETTPDVPLLAGRTEDMLTTRFQTAKFVELEDPASPPLVPGLELTQLTFQGLPMNLGAASSLVRFEVDGLNFTNLNPGVNGETQLDWAVSVSGCGASISVAQASSLCTSSSCSLTLLNQFAWKLSTASPCTITIQRQKASKARMFVPNSSSQIYARIGLVDASGNRALSSGDSDNYYERRVSTYGFRDVLALPSTRRSLGTFTTLTITATTSTGIPATAKPEIWLTAPKYIGIQNTKSYTLKVDGCVSASVSQNFEVADDLHCDYTFKFPLPAGVSILEGGKCAVVFKPADSNPGLLKNPTKEYNVFVDFATVSNGQVVDSCNPVTSSYVPDDNAPIDPGAPPSNEPSNSLSTASGSPSVKAVSALVALAVSMWMLLVVF